MATFKLPAIPNGFPDAQKADEKLLCITVKNHSNKAIIVWGIGPYENDKVKYIECENELDLIKKFLNFWSKTQPDIITGWNIQFFDIPYLVNRIRVVIGDDVLKQLSPWGKVVSDNIILAGRSHLVYNFLGITTLDYLDLYRRFIPVKRENYTLGYIGKTEVDEEKTENPYETFREFYQKISETAKFLKNLKVSQKYLFCSELFQNKIFFYNSFFSEKVSACRCQKWSNTWSNSI